MTRNTRDNFLLVFLLMAAVLFLGGYITYGYLSDHQDRQIAARMDTAPLMARARQATTDEGENALTKAAMQLCKAEPGVESWGLCGRKLADRAKAQALRE